MNWLSLAALVPLAFPCPSVDIHNIVQGRVLITFDRSRATTDPVACILDGHELTVVPPPKYGKLLRADWGSHANELLLSACDADARDTVRCHLERISMDRGLLRTYPDLPVTEFREADGRLTPGGTTGPARVSPNGELLAAAANGRCPALLRMSDGKYIAGLSEGPSTYAWSPEGARLAYTRSPATTRSALQESQLFIYDTQSGEDVQVTHFPPKSYRAWWNPFGQASVHYPQVSGVSWARRAKLILFYVAPDRGVFLWKPEGKETKVNRIDDLYGECWRMTQLSADGRRILYLSSTRRDFCLLNGGDEVRVADMDNSRDRVVLTTRSETDVIVGVNWWTD